MNNLLGLSTWGIVGIVVGGIVLLAVLWIWSTYNELIRKRNQVEEGFATMDVYLKKRYDLIPNLVETVKGYAKHEKDTLAEVVKLRNTAVSASSIDEKVQAENNFANGLRQVFALAENYPNLKADTNFADLQNQLKAVEVDIANARKYYNAVVKDFNNSIQVFPNSIIAKNHNFKKFEMFAVADGAERENVKVKF